MYSEYVDIYVYMINKQGKLVESPAFILRKVSKMVCIVTAYDRDDKTIVCEIPKEPGMIFNNALWFRKQDFEKAKKIFLLDYMNKINKTDDDLRILNEKWAILDKQKEAIK